MRCAPSHRRFPLALDRLVARERLEDNNNNNNNNEFVLVSFWRHINVVDYRHACVDEEQGEGGQAGREKDVGKIAVRPLVVAGQGQFFCESPIQSSI